MSFTELNINVGLLFVDLCILKTVVVITIRVQLLKLNKLIDVTDVLLYEIK